MDTLEDLYSAWLATTGSIEEATRSPWAAFKGGWVAHIRVARDRGDEQDREQWMRGRVDARRELGLSDED